MKKGQNENRKKMFEYKIWKNKRKKKTEERKAEVTRMKGTGRKA